MPQRNLSLALGATAAKELYEKQVPTNLPTLSPPLFIPLYEAREMEPPTQRKLKAGQDGQDCIISEPLCNRVASHLEQAYLELFPLSDSLTISLDGRTDGWIVCVPLAMPQTSTSVTTSGTDGSSGLASIRGTKWHATTDPDGFRHSVLFFAFE